MDEVASRHRAPEDFDLLLIGASTGGPTALRALLAALSPRFHAPIVVVQHMPAGLTEGFARRLDGRPLPACQASDGMTLRPGRVHVAPGGRHLVLEGGTIRLVDTPPRHGVRPAFDVSLGSALDFYGGVVVVVLSGMGRDGADGARARHDRGARVLAQDAGSSVVWGMPGAVVRAGIADVEGSPETLGALLESWSLRRRLGAGRVSMALRAPWGL